MQAEKQYLKHSVIYKLDQISDIWNNFIWEYKFCRKKIKFTTEVQTNYFGDIIGYYQDTFDIIFDDKESKSHFDKFSYHISLLQSIYVQQDFIEELLRIFKFRLDKGDLKKNLNYSINRDIRNELVGHPIRRKNGNGKLISSSLFAYNHGSDKIVYLRYHQDNDYEFEKMEFPVKEVIQRHKLFLDEYFDNILNKLKQILNSFVKEIEKLERLIEQKAFEDILTITGHLYESIFESTYIYDKESLLKIYKKKDEHKRYQNIIDQFYKDLKNGLSETKDYVIYLFEPKTEKIIPKIERPVLDTKIIEQLKIIKQEKEAKVTYHYELQKLSSKRNKDNFGFHSSSLRSKCLENKTVIEELSHMESNIDNIIEYYSALYLIRLELKNN